MARQLPQSSFLLLILIAAPVVLAVVLYLRPARDQSGQPAAPAVTPLTVITYNVQFLPGPGRALNKRPDVEYRARELGRLLAEYDIVGLNEVFDDEPRELLLKTLRERLGERFHLVRPPAEQRSAFGIDSGLAIVSRLPILESHSVRYGNDSSPLRFGLMADGFASKGVLHARIGRHPDAPPNECLDVFVTHLESKDRKAREEQYGKLADFVRKHAAPDRPALILGDFNTRGNPAHVKDLNAPYHKLMAALKGARQDLDVIDLWPHLSKEEGGTNNQESASGDNRIDYLFLSNPAKGQALRPKAIRVNRFLDKKVVALSDHSAVEAELEW